MDIGQFAMNLGRKSREELEDDMKRRVLTGTLERLHRENPQAVEALVGGNSGGYGVARHSQTPGEFRSAMQGNDRVVGTYAGSPNDGSYVPIDRRAEAEKDLALKGQENSYQQARMATDKMSGGPYDNMSREATDQAIREKYLSDMDQSAAAQKALLMGRGAAPVPMVSGGGGISPSHVRSLQEHIVGLKASGADPEKIKGAEAQLAFAMGGGASSAASLGAMPVMGGVGYSAPVTVSRPSELSRIVTAPGSDQPLLTNRTADEMTQILAKRFGMSPDTLKAFGQGELAYGQNDISVPPPTQQQPVIDGTLYGAHANTAGGIMPVAVPPPAGMVSQFRPHAAPMPANTSIRENPLPTLGGPLETTAPTQDPMVMSKEDAQILGKLAAKGVNPPQVPSLGFGKAGLPSRLEYLHAFAQEIKDNPDKYINAKAAVSSGMAAAKQDVTIADSMVQSHERILGGFQILRQEAAKVGNKMPMILATPMNEMAKKWGNDPAMSRYIAAVQVVLPEYAKLMSGNGMNRALQDQQLNHAKEILAQGMSEKQLNSVLDMLESEMNVTMDAVGKVATRRVENVSTPSLGGSSSAVSDSDLVDSWGKR